MAPSNIDWTQYHKIGFLWVPATSSTNGSATYYLDRQQMGDAATWAQFTGQSPPPTGQPWTFGILDSQHLAIMIGTGTNQPMTVQSVNVWQASAAGNLVQ